MPQIMVHDTFYPHPHMRDLKAEANRGKILVITLVFATGLTILVSSAIIKNRKKEDSPQFEPVNPSQLRSCVVEAVIACKNGLRESKTQALKMAFSAYAKKRGIKWKERFIDNSQPATLNIGHDMITITINGDFVEVQSVCGRVIATATMETHGSVKTSISNIG